MGLQLSNEFFKFEVGDRYKTLESNNNLVYEIKKITTTKWGDVILFDRGDGKGSTHTLGKQKVIDYINKGRMIKV